MRCDCVVSTAAVDEPIISAQADAQVIERGGVNEFVLKPAYGTAVIVSNGRRGLSDRKSVV